MFAGLFYALSCRVVNVWRLYLVCQPTHGISSQGVYGETQFLNAVAGGAFERAFLKAALTG
jgi:hypothetical protein